MEKVAILLPVYAKDSPFFFKDALESLRKQTLRSLRIYIGVDGPVGNDLKIVLDDLSDDKDIVVCWFKKNRGLACVLNDLVRKALEDGYVFLARMDADDISLPERMDKQVAFLADHPEVDVVGGAIEEINGEGVLKGKRVEYPLTHDACRIFFRYRDPLAHPAVMFRARYFEKVEGGYRPEYRKNQDTMLWFDGFMNGCVFANLSETVLYFRVNDDFYNRRNGWKRAKQMLKDRLKMNKALGYDISANLFAVAMLCMTISPAWVKKILYRIR